MNEEEKKAIEELSKKAVICKYESRDYPNMICFKKDMIIVLNLIEKLQKENEGLKAKLEYKEYGDLDNVEFEKYINEIVETRTKELKEQLEEEQELNKIIKETRINKVLENNIEVKKLREENEELKADNYEANNIIKDLLDNIPVQKVKDKIEKLNNISNAEKLEDTMIGGNYTITELVQYVLQELIEERKEK